MAKIYLATWLMEPSQGEAQTKVKSWRRLLSYHFIREMKLQNEQFREYVHTGLLETRKKK